MNWVIVLSVAAGAYAFKALGLVVLGGRQLPAPLQRCLDFLPAALLPALIAVNTVTDGSRLVIDPRLAGVGLAGLAAWRRAPFPVVIVIGAAVTGLLRHRW